VILAVYESILSHGKVHGILSLQQINNRWPIESMGTLDLCICATDKSLTGTRVLSVIDFSPKIR
jgi:hypothetical protein